MAGALERTGGLSGPAAPLAAKVKWLQSTVQSRLVTAGPSGPCAPRFLAQHLPWEAHDEHFDSVMVRAASPAREADDKSEVRHTAMTERTSRESDFLPSIPLGHNYTMRTLLEAAERAS